MNSAEHKNWNTKRRLVMAFICPALLLLISLGCSAQPKVAATPNAFDPAKPQPIVLSVKKANEDTTDLEVIRNVKFVRVGDRLVIFQIDEQKGTITLTDLPPSLTGQQQVQLLGADIKNPIGSVPLQYPNADANPTPTPDLARLQQMEAEKRRGQLVTHWWYYLLIASSFVGLMGAFTYLIYRGIKYARATYRSPSGLPVGSFRAILAYTLVAYLGFYILASLLSVSYFAPPDFLLGIVATVIGFYFGSRTGEDGGADANGGTVRGIVRQDKNPVSGALVKFKRDDGTEPYIRITDVDGGRFVLQGAKPGKYKVSATVTGSTASGQQELTIAEGSDQEIEIVIKSAAPGPPPPPPTGSVQGTVKKADGSVAAGATVKLSQNNVEKGNATTDATGRYIINNVVVGAYDIVVSLGGASSTPQSVNVTAGAAQTIDLMLQ